MRLETRDFRLETRDLRFEIRDLRLDNFGFQISVDFRFWISDLKMI